MNLLRILRYAAYTVGTLVLIGVLALLALAAFVDGAFVKARLQRYLLEHEHRTLSIEGEPKLRLFPILSLSLGRTELSQPDSREPFVALDSAEVAVRVLPLLAGELVIENLSARGVRIAVRERKESGGKEPPAPKPPPEAKQELRKLLVRQIDIQDVKVSYVDENTGRQVNVDDLALKLGPLADEVASPLTFSAKLSGRNPPVALDARATGLVKVGFARQSLAIEKLDARLAGNAGDAKGLDVRLSGELGFDARGEQLEVNGLQLSASGMLDRDALQARLSAPRIALTRERAAGSAVSGTLRIAGPERRIDATLELAPVEGSFSALLLPRVAIALDATAQGGRVKARLASALRANLREGSWELPDCSAEISASHPKLPQPFRLPLKASFKADRRTFSANASSNAEEFDFLLKLDATNRRPLRAKFDFSSRRLNLDRYPVIALGGGKSDDRLDLSGLMGPELQGKIRIGALQANGVKLADVRADVKLARGVLEALHGARLYGGTLSGSLGARAGSNQMAVKEELRGVQIDPLLRDLAKRDLLEGTGDVNLDVAGSGATMPAFKRSLAGSARTVIRNGAYKGFNLGAALRGVQALAAGRPAPGGEPKKTEFTELSATFDIRRGVAHNEDLKLESQVLRSSGSGDFDIAASTLDYTLKPTLLAGAGERLAGASIPVRVHGPLDALKYDVDTRAIVSQQLRGRALEQLNRQLGPRGDDKGASPQDQLRDTLRGLLGRQPK